MNLEYDVVIATERKYINPVEFTEHIKITLLEDDLLKKGAINPPYFCV